MVRENWAPRPIPVGIDIGLKPAIWRLPARELVSRLAAMFRQSDHGKMTRGSGRPCLHCGKLFAVATGHRRVKRDNFCSTGCEADFRSQFDLCFVQGCRRQKNARGLCLSHSRAQAARVPGRGPARMRLSPLLKYGLGRQRSLAGPVHGSPTAGRWQRILEWYRLLDRRFGPGAALDDSERSEPLSSGTSVELEIEQAHVIRSPLI